MDVEIKEIFVDSPKVNLVTVNDSLNNYMIVPPSKEKSESTPIVLKSLVLERLNIVNNRGIRYRDLKSGMDFTLHTDTLSLNFKDKEKRYRLALEQRQSKRSRSRYKPFCAIPSWRRRGLGHCQTRESGS